MSVDIIKASGVTKEYRSGGKIIHALNGISLTINSGEIFSLVGPNGAGKSTFIKILLGITKPTMGSVELFEADSQRQKKKHVGYLPETFKVPSLWKAGELLRYLGSLSGMARAELQKKIPSILSLVGLKENENQRIKTFSKGMMVRLGIAQALLHSPQLVFLDEPTDGLDPVGRRLVKDLLISLRNRGVTIFLNSHMLSEIEAVADRVGMLYQGTFEMLYPSDVTHSYYEIIVDQKPDDGNTWRQINNNSWRYIVATEGSLAKIKSFVESQKISLISVQQYKPTLEELFFIKIEQYPKQ